MKKHLLLLFISSIADLSAQTILSGYIYDVQSREPLIGATVYDSLSKTGTLSNEYGYYRLYLKQSNTNIRVSYVGYQSERQVMTGITKDTIIDFLLTPSVALTTVTIIANRDDNIEAIQPGKVNIPLERLQSIPSVGGERDILKALSVLPGISNGAEGSSSLLVRGGGQDQNLFVLDGANVYNTGHLLNFISVFNPDALKKVDFYKGGFPARFGGRLSSVVDVTFREGNKKQFEGKFDVGLINSKFTLEGPLSKSGKTSYLFAARSTYLDFVQGLFGNSRKAVRRSRRESFTGYTFYDINAKINHEFDDKNKFYVSYYEGLDLLRLVQKPEFTRRYTDYSNSIVNRLISGRYFRIFKPHFSMNVGMNYTVNAGGSKNYDLSRFDFTTIDQKPIYDEINDNRKNYLEDYSAFVRFDYTPIEKHFIRFGLEGTVHQYKTHFSTQLTRRYTDDSTILSIDNTLTNPLLRGYESAMYLEDDIRFNQNLVANIGFRGSLFKSVDKTFTNLEPRFSLRYTIPDWFSMNMTAARTVQYSHALLSNEIGLEKLIWVPASANYQPEIANQISLGITKQFKNTGIDFSFEGYYKTMSNLMQFVFYNDFGENIYQNWDQNTLRNGKGKAYGFEFLLNKTAGRFNGLLSYTLAWNQRRFEEINSGQWYPFKYDRRHNINLYASYQLSKKWKLGALWTYNTGFRITIPDGQLTNVPFFDNKELLYTSVNNGKMPDYHRLDLNAINEKVLKNGRIRTWSINIYNAYSRLNPLFIYVRKEYTDFFTKKTIPAQMKGIVLLPVLPSVNYALKF